MAEPIADPGIEPHEYRITDIDPKAADRVERQVSTMFVLAGLLALGSCVAYFAIPRDSELVFGPLTGNANNMMIGLCLGLALFLIGAGAIQWAKKLMVDEEISEDRHPAHSSPEQIADITEAFKQGVDGVRFRPAQADPPRAVRRAGPARPAGHRAAARPRSAAGPRAVPHDLGRRASGSSTTSRPRPIKPSDMVIGQLVNAIPANLPALQEENAIAYQNANGRRPR